MARSRGRPPVGERISVRLSPELLETVDRLCVEAGATRAATIRHLLETAVRQSTDGVDRAQIRRMLAMEPRDRIRHMAEVTRGLQRFRHRAADSR
jgi:metal-responsive CopG/Arc/MetJ family transcriptional regulator